MKKEWMGIGLVVLVAVFVMLFKLGATPLLDPDEPVYAQTAMEMMVSNDFISPRIYGDFWFDKPPMYYWLVAGMTKIFGQTELAARLPSAILAIGGVTSVYFIGRSVMNKRTALISGLVLATSFEYFYLGKAAVTDITLTYFFSAALFAYLRNRYDLMCVCMGLAVLTKGPVGVVLPCVIIFLHLLLTKQLRMIKALNVFRGILMIVLVGAPWYFLMYTLHGMDFISTFLGFHNITRFLQPEHASGTKIYYYIPVLFIGFFPWSVYLLQAVKSGIENCRGTRGNALVLLLTWIAVVFVFFSVSQTKLISYILPMYPPMALLVGWYIDRCLSLGLHKSFLKGTLGLAVLSSLIIAILSALSVQRLDYVLPGIGYLSVVLLCMISGAAYANYRRKNLQSIASLVAGMVCFVVVFMHHILPVAAEFVSVKNLAEVFKEKYQDKNIPVYVDKFYRPGFCYYTGIAGEELGNRFTILVDNQDKAYFLMKEDKYLNLSDAERIKLRIVAKQADMVLVYKS